ncbi:MAG: hypothetical protein SRB2_02085 [Desulfobacteraceae bacterium Eth-SRB2]|nr:MAG: hypothetical protein SRB2_02085 [Desulfobacteraceae bacterium Eth-SRB2]
MLNILVSGVRFQVSAYSFQVSGVRRHAALRQRFIIYAIHCRFLSELPAAFSLRDFPLQCFL